MTVNVGDKKINAGDILHLLEIAVLLISVGIGYARFDAAAEKVFEQGQRLERVEHYLSSKDPQYWRLSRENQ